MWHMPSTGVSGVDLYVFNDGLDDEKAQTWLFVAHFGPPSYPSFEGSIEGIGGGDGVVKTYRIHLPLYNTINSLELGVDSNYTITASTSVDKSDRILWYGTSIAQGAVASRPGTTFTNVIRNNVGKDVVNLGFSGNCLMEMDVAQEVLVKVSGVTLAVIDCLPNMDADMVKERAAPLVRYLRQEWGEDVPIVLAEGTTYGGAWLIDSVKEGQDAKRKALKQQFDVLRNEGVANIFYVEGAELSGDNDWGTSPTVEGTHLTDIGHAAVASYYSKFLPTLWE